MGQIQPNFANSEPVTPASANAEKEEFLERIFDKMEKTEYNSQGYELTLEKRNSRPSLSLDDYQKMFTYHDGEEWTRNAFLFVGGFAVLQIFVREILPKYK